MRSSNGALPGLQLTNAKQAYHPPFLKDPHGPVLSTLNSLLLCKPVLDAPLCNATCAALRQTEPLAGLMTWLGEFERLSGECEQVHLYCYVKRRRA